MRVTSLLVLYSAQNGNMLAYSICAFGFVRLRLRFLVAVRCGMAKRRVYTSWRGYLSEVLTEVRHYTLGTPVWGVLRRRSQAESRVASPTIQVSWASGVPRVGSGTWLSFLSLVRYSRAPVRDEKLNSKLGVDEVPADPWMLSGAAGSLISALSTQYGVPAVGCSFFLISSSAA